MEQKAEGRCVPQSDKGKAGNVNGRRVQVRTGLLPLTGGTGSIGGERGRVFDMGVSGGVPSGKKQRLVGVMQRDGATDPETDQCQQQGSPLQKLCRTRARGHPVGILP